MRYHNTKKLSDKIITREDIRDIAAFFEEIARQNGGACRFSIDFCDATDISDENATVFDSSFFKGKDIKALSFVYQDKNYTKMMKVSLREELAFSDITNTFEITSSDEEWFITTEARLNAIFNGLQDYPIVHRAVRLPILPFTYVGFQVIVCLIMHLSGFVYGIKPDSENVIFIPISRFVFLSVAGFVLIVAAIRWLYPEVEFAFETNKHLKRRKIRKLLAWLLGTIIIPVALGSITS